MHVVVAGASGFLGTPLVDHLRERGHRVTRLVRSGTSAEGTSRWDPAAGQVDQGLIDDADAVVCLSGASIARWPRTAAYKRELVASRVDTTATLARAIAASSTPTVLLSGSAMGLYGTDRGDEVLTEDSTPGPGFLAELVQAWERAAQPAVEAGQRVCFLRTGLPLHRSGGLLGPLLLPFKLGAGPRLGTGRQYMALLSRHDWVRAVAFLLEHDHAVGPFNLVMPQQVTNAELTDALGQALHRPTVLAVPKVAVKAVLGPLADDMFGSMRLEPTALVEAGFLFDHPDLPGALHSALTS